MVIYLLNKVYIYAYFALIHSLVLWILFPLERLLQIKKKLKSTCLQVKVFAIMETECKLPKLN